MIGTYHTNTNPDLYKLELHYSFVNLNQRLGSEGLFGFIFTGEIGSFKKHTHSLIDFFPFLHIFRLLGFLLTLNFKLFLTSVLNITEIKRVKKKKRKSNQFKS